MLRNFVDDDDMVVPLTANRYRYVNGNGVLDMRTLKFLEIIEKNNDLFVEIDFGRGLELKKLGFVVALATKRIRLPYYLWDRLDVLFVNGDSKDVRPGNLVWKFPEGGLESKIKGFFYIPGYSGYAISKNGEVWSSFVNKLISSYIDSYGYRIFGINPDVGKRSISGQHRLKALAFIPYTGNVDDLDVNHIDGNKCNNDLKNLEWVSRKRNCDHAYSTGLRDDNFPTLVRNVFTGDVVRFYSIEEAGRRLGLDGETVRLRLAFGYGKVYPPGIQIKRESDSRPWVEVKDPIDAVHSSKIPLPILVENLLTGEVKEYPSMTAIKDIVKVKSGTIAYYFKDKKCVKIWGDYKVYYPNFEERTKSVFAEMQI